MDDDRLDRLIAEELPRVMRRGGDCGTVEQWAAMATGELDAAHVQRLERHAAGCALCAAEKRLASAMLGEADDADAPDVERIVRRLERQAPGRVIAPRPRRWQSTVVPLVALAAAATVIFAIVPGLTLFERPPALGEAPVPGDLRSARVTLAAPLGDIAAPPGTLEWRAVPGAYEYRVILRGVDGSILWEQVATGATTVAIPPPTRARLHAAVSYEWQVEAYDEGGSLLAWSESARFRVTGGPSTDQ